MGLRRNEELSGIRSRERPGLHRSRVEEDMKSERQGIQLLLMEDLPRPIIQNLSSSFASIARDQLSSQKRLHQPFFRILRATFSSTTKSQRIAKSIYSSLYIKTSNRHARFLIFSGRYVTIYETNTYIYETLLHIISLIRSTC